MSRLFIVRHGNTFSDGEAPRRIGAATDLPLVPSGVEQARTLGQLFRRSGIAFSRALAGPLSRTRQTASLILEEAEHAPGLAVAEWLAEIDHGPDENRSETEVLGRVGAVALERWDAAGVTPPDWRVDGAARTAAWRALMNEAPPGDTLLVTSNGAARFALLALSDRCSPLRSMKLATGAYGVLARSAAGWSMETWNVRDQVAGQEA